MKVAVIGTGNIGTALGSSLVRAGHEVVYAAAHPERAMAVAGAVGGTAVANAAEAATAAEVVVLAVPAAAAVELAESLGSAVSGKVVIDVTNPLTSDYSGLANVGGPSIAERLAGLLPHARVAKAFNTLFASVQADPATHGSRLDALFATDDETAALAVTELASSIGFRPVRIGGLAAARELEALAWLNIRLQLRAGGDWRTSYVLVGAPPAALAA